MRLFASFFFLSFVARAAMPYQPTPDVELLYKVKCSSCHGVDGSGGVGASFKAKLAHPTTASLEGVIKNGIPGTAMPPSGLADPAIHKLALYVQYLNKKK